MRKYPYHLMGNLLCSIDVETTGLDPEKHDIIQIAVVPLDTTLNIVKDAIPFYTTIRPIKFKDIDLDALNISALKFSDLLCTALDPYKVSELFEEWYNNLNLPFGKKIVPVGHNYIGHDKPFLQNWLGKESYNIYFDFHCRDTMIAAQYINDQNWCFAEEPPFPSLKLGDLCRRLNVKLVKAHDALSDAIATAECYKKLLTWKRFIEPEKELQQMLMPYLKWGKNSRETLTQMIKIYEQHENSKRGAQANS